jgi:HD-GYP domain-containing protein (c-di-GMP phosphodiesterase class II)
MHPNSALRKNALFSSLSPEEMNWLCRVGEMITAPPGVIILREGESTTELYVILNGQVEVSVTDKMGGRVELAVLKRGDHFGEMSFIDGQPRSASVVAMKTCRLLRIPRHEFQTLIGQHPRIVFGLMQGLSATIRKVTRQLEDLVFMFTHEELQNAHLDTIRRLAMAAEYKDDNTGSHLERVGRISELLARGLGLSETEVSDIRHAAPMHDIGKIGIPERILLKPGKLEPHEWATMQTHTLIGGRILSNPVSNLMRRAREIALSHHERFDGKGYPNGLKGEKIPLSARIVGLADVFDALISERPYKPPYTAEQAGELIRAQRGRHFDPKLVDLFEKLFDAFRDLAAWRPAAPPSPA